ncbi:GHMP kinase [Jimgerdemannia flammicorona]|uniref:Mevalonate kinase n=1 Tax=Jimgerdemannia flammicorona TaxID=994334 RepID=A0A433QBN9_9FUNG|nr:GHMP kinase [Jimgerdemannia flammicorona]
MSLSVRGIKLQRLSSFSIQTAIAASLGLRSYLFLQARDDEIIQLTLPDVGLDKTWSASTLPGPLPYVPEDGIHPLELPSTTKSTLETMINLPSGSQTAGEQAALAFLYLYLCLYRTTAPAGLTICVRSMVPVSAGLGSSASYSVCIATALLIHFGHISPSIVHDAAEGKHTETINTWAYKAEQVLHGNPSGIDNAVSTFGGAKLYVKGQGFTTLSGFSSLRFLLTNTKVPRSTKLLVAGVGDKKSSYPSIMDPILDAIQGVSDECKDVFQAHEQKLVDRKALLEKIQDLIDLNHWLLGAIGVSHPSLEKVREVTAQFGLRTKLTGAGGGGCAVTLIRDDVDPDTVAKAITILNSFGFDCFETSVGGPGIGVTSVGAGTSSLVTAEGMRWATREELEAVSGWRFF